MGLEKIKRKASQKAPFMLCITASIGVVGTAISASKQTIKAAELLNRCKETNCGKVKTFAVVAPLYAPTAGIAIGTIICIFGANYLSRKQQASILAAYKLLERSYKDYRQKVTETLGSEVDKKIMHELAIDDYKTFADHPSEDDDLPLFYESYGRFYFNNSNENVAHAMYKANRELIKEGFITFNSWLKLIDQEPIEGGDEIGWSITDGSLLEMNGGYEWIDFEFDHMDLEDGMECYEIWYATPPYNIFDEF